MAHEKQRVARMGAFGQRVSAQMLFFRAANGNAFTIFRAGLAFTITTLPKISFLPAFVAGFVRVFSLNKPGMANTPVLVTSCVAISAKLPMSFAHTDFFNSHSFASASAIAPFVMGLPAAFIVFMGAISSEAVRSVSLGDVLCQQVVPM